MHDAPEGAEFSRAWNADRSHLIDLAFRMLADIGEAEEVVQEAFSRLARTDLASIEDARGWLTVVTSRLCLDRIRSARSRRERPHDFTGADPVGELGPQRRSVDPADRVTLDDSVRLALLVVMERLSPGERVVFVLHDIFQMPFDEIAETVGRSAPSCRQLARRARQKIEANADGRRFDIGASEHRAVTQRFIAACADGDLEGLLEVLDPDVSGEVDRGDAPALGVVHGADQVGANLLKFWSGATLVSLPIDGQPALLAFRNRRLAGVIALTVDSEEPDRVAQVHVIADPAKLAFVQSQLSMGV